MVYMKTRPTPKNPKQIKKGKKAAPVQQEDDGIDSDDMDDSEGSEEAPQLQKTPLNKGTKGRQSLREQKVSISTPGKNSPAAKTPKKDISILAKKQHTPANKGKTSMPEFKGMNGNKNQPQEEEDDEGDDFEMDEVEDDLDLDLNDVADEDDDSDDADSDDDDNDEDDDDNDEDDDDNEEEDDDDSDEDDDEEEEENIIQKTLSTLKQKKKSPTTGQTPQNEQSGKTVPQSQSDATKLYVGGLPKDVTSEELKALSDDIIDVVLLKNKPKTYAFLIFNTEADAESAYKALESKNLRGLPLTFDFVGAKSNKRGLDMRKLYVSEIPLDCTIDQVGACFKTAFEITLNKSPLFRTAMISFSSEEDAKEAYEANKETVLSGQELAVSYARTYIDHMSKKRKHSDGGGSEQNNHVSRDRASPTKRVGGGGGNRANPRSGGRACFKCNEEGHIARDCPTGGSGGRGNSGGFFCYKCNGEGHISRNCPAGGSGGAGGKSGGVMCFKCNEEGHISRNCPTGGSGGGGKPGGRVCFKCNEKGHISRDCPNADKSGNPSKKMRFSKQEKESEE